MSWAESPRGTHPWEMAHTTATTIGARAATSATHSAMVGATHGWRRTGSASGRIGSARVVPLMTQVTLTPIHDT